MCLESEVEEERKQAAMEVWLSEPHFVKNAAIFPSGSIITTSQVLSRYVRGIYLRTGRVFDWEACEV